MRVGLGAVSGEIFTGTKGGSTGGSFCSSALLATSLARYWETVLGRDTVDDDVVGEVGGVVVEAAVLWAARSWATVDVSLFRRELALAIRVG